MTPFKLASSLRRITSSGNYRPEIDGLRFIAIGIVLIGHFAERVLRFYENAGSASVVDAVRFIAVPGTGVLLFFTISSFIISSQFIAWKKGFRLYLRGFFVRRVSRIYPPYLVVILGTWLLLRVTGMEVPGLRTVDASEVTLDQSLLASIFYANGLAFGEVPRLFGPGWSLEIEIQFYVIAPFVLLAYFMIDQTRMRLAAGLAILAGLSAISLMLPPLERDTWHLQYSLANFAPYFWLGVLIADARPEGGGHPLAADIAGWIAVAALFLSPHIESAPLTMLVRLASIAAIFVAARAGGGFQAAVSRAPVAIVGGACYSIYLIHLQLFQFFFAALAKFVPGLDITAALLIGLVLAFPVVLLCGMIFYVLLERPFMQLDWTRRLARLLGMRTVFARDAANSEAPREGDAPPSEKATTRAGS